MPKPSEGGGQRKRRPLAPNRRASLFGEERCFGKVRSIGPIGLGDARVRTTRTCQLLLGAAGRFEVASDDPGALGSIRQRRRVIEIIACNLATYNAAIADCAAIHLQDAHPGPSLALGCRRRACRGRLSAPSASLMNITFANLHDDRGYTGTRQSLAKRVGMSCSVFVRRFRQTVGAARMEVSVVFWPSLLWARSV